MSTTSTSAGPSMFKILGSSAMSKVGVMVLSGALAVITTRLIIEHFGIGAYAQYGLLTSMGSLVPFADLGMSAAIINILASSENPRADAMVRRTLTTAFRVLVGSALVLITIGVVLSLTGAWPSVLGEGLQPGGSTAALVCVLIFAITLPLGVGQRILTGLGKNHIQISTQAIAAPFVLGTVTVLVLTGAQAGNFVAVLSYTATTIVAAVALFLASRAIKPQLAKTFREVPKVRSSPGVRIMDVAWPMLAQMIALPIAMQTDRLLLSHLASNEELAQYNLGSQLFGMITQTISAAGIALWPVYARARAKGEIKSPIKLSMFFLLGGVGLAAVLALMLPWVAPLISGGRITLDVWLAVAFVAFVGAQAAKYPLGMYMTDIRGLRFQVLPIVAMIPLNLGLSWILVEPIGAAGPVVGSAVAVTICQVLPNFWYVRRDLKVRRRAADDSAALRAAQGEAVIPLPS